MRVVREERDCTLPTLSVSDTSAIAMRNQLRERMVLVVFMVVVVVVVVVDVMMEGLF
jgi:hypothetical protein